MQHTDAWLAAKGQLRLQLQPITYEQCFRRAEFISCEDGTLTIMVESQMIADYIQRRFGAAIIRSYNRLPVEGTVQHLVCQPRKADYPYDPNAAIDDTEAVQHHAPNPKPIPKPPPAPPPDQRPAASKTVTVAAGVISLRQSDIPDPATLSGKDALTYLGILRNCNPDGTWAAKAAQVARARGAQRGQWGELKGLESAQIIKIEEIKGRQQRKKIIVLGAVAPRTFTENVPKGRESCNITRLFGSKRPRTGAFSGTLNDSESESNTDSKIHSINDSMAAKCAILEQELGMDTAVLAEGELAHYSLVELQAVVTHARQHSRNNPAGLAVTIIRRQQKVQMRMEVQA
jgi:hypothetical protein